MSVAPLAIGNGRLDLDIAGQAGEVPFQFHLAWVGDTLEFGARADKVALVHPTVAPEAWYFGLWYFDCAELFLANSRTGRYLEVNLAPNAAYWIGIFNAPRQRDESLDPSVWSVERGARVEHDSWRTAVRLPWANIVEALGGEPDRANVTAVLGGCPDVDIPAENLRSYIPIDPIRPDFHVPDQFAPIQWGRS